jgi:two-component system sensor histidine kinase DesK
MTRRGFTNFPPDVPADFDTIGEALPGAPDRPLNLRRALTFAGARKWYAGGLFGVAWICFTAYDFFNSTHNPVLQIVGSLLITIFGAVAALSVPFAWWLPIRRRALAAAGLWVASFLLIPVIGVHFVQTWVFVGVIIGMSMFTMRTTYLLTAVLAGLILLVQFLTGTRGNDLVWLPAVTFGMTMMMTGFSRQIAAIHKLRQTQHELARLAVERERGRVARDIHDILGHSLTTIAIKSELAGMLIETDSHRAASEIAAVEGIARTALADMRSTVAGYRGVSVVAELANAKSVLASAGITPELPTTVETLDADHRELAGWVVREGVTNILRHSGATRCRISVDERHVEIADDGRGPRAETGDGTGLIGLTERVEAAGGRLSTGTSELGGFSLRAEWATA